MLKINYSYKGKSKCFEDSLSNLEQRTIGSLVEPSELVTFEIFKEFAKIESPKIKLKITGASTSTGTPHKSFIDRNTVNKVKIIKPVSKQINYVRLASKYLNPNDSQINLAVTDE